MPETKPKKEIPRQVNISRVDTKEFELPETFFISDIDTKVFQGIALQCLSEIEGIALVEGNFIDNLFGRSGPEVGNGIQSEQDTKNHSVSIKIEVDVQYGISIPQKAEEIQSKIVEEITRLTGLRVAAVHVVFKNIIPLDTTESTMNYLDKAFKKHSASTESEYNDEF